MTNFHIIQRKINHIHLNPSARPNGINFRKDFAVLDGGGKRLQTRTRQTFWDKMHLAKVI